MKQHLPARSDRNHPHAGGYFARACIFASENSTVLPPVPYRAFYRAFTDASGGAVGSDAYCICVAHKEDAR